MSLEHSIHKKTRKPEKIKGYIKRTQEPIRIGSIGKGQYTVSISKENKCNRIETHSFIWSFKKCLTDDHWKILKNLLKTIKKKQVFIHLSYVNCNWEYPNRRGRKVSFHSSIPSNKQRRNDRIRMSPFFSPFMNSWT